MNRDRRMSLPLLFPFRSFSRMLMLLLKVLSLCVFVCVLVMELEFSSDGDVGYLLKIKYSSR